MRIILSVCLLFVFSAAALSPNTIWGTPNSSDAIVYKKNATLPGTHNYRQEVFYNIPESYKSNSRVISSIVVEDHFKFNTGPDCSLIAGGPGWTFATVRMVTQLSYGLNVTLTVYGRYVY